MTTKDRTKDLRARVESIGEVISLRPTDGKEAGYDEWLREIYPPQSNDKRLLAFLEEADKVHSDLKRLEDLVDEIRQKHDDIVDAPVRDDELAKSIECLMAEVKRLAHKIQRKLDKIKREGQLLDTSRADVSTSAYLRIRTTQLQVMSHKFYDIMADYNAENINQEKRCKRRIKNYYQLVYSGRTIDDEEIDKLVSGGQFWPQGFQFVNEDARRMRDEVEARHEEILKLEESITQLHGLFGEIQMLVHDQGDLINHIEHHIQNAADYVESGRQRLRQATKYRDKYRKKKALCFALIGVVVLAIGLIVLSYLSLNGLSKKSGGGGGTSVSENRIFSNQTQVQL